MKGYLKVAFLALTASVFLRAVPFIEVPCRMDIGEANAIKAHFNYIYAHEDELTQELSEEISHLLEVHGDRLTDEEIDYLSSLISSMEVRLDIDQSDQKDK
ncbi:MAG: hypothetical protein ACRCX8_20265 [Sarcina sp.]